jgi:Protein of unknown function (DUF551)
MEWISVNDLLPVPYLEVLLFASMNEHISRSAYEVKENQKKQFVGYLDFTGDYNCVYGDGYIPFHNEEITHWMSLPENPKEKSL